MKSFSKFLNENKILENIVNEEVFTKAHIDALKSAYGNIKKIDPNSSSYKKLTKMLNSMTDEQLKSLAKADIKFVSSLAKNRLREEVELNEENTISKMRDMVNKKTKDRLMIIGGKPLKVSLKDASYLITLYDNQSSKSKKELEKEISTRDGLKSVIDDMYESLDEAKSASGYTINHKTFSSAVQHAKAQVEKQGYEIEDDEWDRKVAMGPRKPGRGKTNKYTIDLMKNGKETRRKLQMQVYYDEGRYELNMYIS